MSEYYLVGGRVRSLYTNELIATNADYDVVVVGSTYVEVLKYLVSKDVDIKVPEAQYIQPILNCEFEYHKYFDKPNSNWTSFSTGVIKVGLKNLKGAVDYVLARKAEVYDNNNVAPSSIVINPQVTLDEDISRRDFKMNSLCLELLDPLDMNSYIKGTTYDLCGGIKDINNKIINTIGDPLTTFKEDPSRILRLIKFMLRLDYEAHEDVMWCLKADKLELAHAFQTKMNVDRTVQELKHIFNIKYNSYKAFSIFYKLLGRELAEVILNNHLFLNPTKIDDAQVRRLDKWR